MKVVVDDLSRRGQLAYRERLQGPHEFVDALAGETVVHMSAHLAKGHERYLPQSLQVSARIAYGEPGLTSEHLHRLFPLRQQVQQEEPRPTPDGPPDICEVLEQFQLGSVQFHGSWVLISECSLGILVFYRILE